MIASQTRYDAKPFDVSLSQLPSHYVGNDPVAVYEKAKDALAPKNEFETNDEYEARVKKATETLGLYAFPRLQYSGDNGGFFEYEIVS